MTDGEPEATATFRQRVKAVARPALLILLGLVVGVGGTVALGMNRTDSETPKPSEVDIGFSQDMSAHHAQANLMCQILLTGGGSPEVDALAKSIENGQLGEIGTMQGWLTLWNAPPVGAHSPMAWMGAPTGGHDMSAMDKPATGTMPGMASQEELNALSALSGKALDISFLQLMLRHHHGGIQMATYAAGHTSTTAVQAIANRMVLEEQDETTLMSRLLQIDGAQPLPNQSKASQ